MGAEQLRTLEPGQLIVYGGDRVTRVPPELAAAFAPGDRLVVVQSTGDLLHVPREEVERVDGATRAARRAFLELGTVDDDAISAFFGDFAGRLADDTVFAPIAEANAADVADARRRGRSTTRLELSQRMRADMVDGLHGWRDAAGGRDSVVEVLEHPGWRVEQRRAPLGVVGFVFEGRPNVFADACGVLRGGNTVVFRIGSDALGTARAIVAHALAPALEGAGLPPGAVALLDSPARSAGWALFSHPGLALAVARGSGEAVEQLGAVARQAGVPVSLHGTGGAWLVAGGLGRSRPLRRRGCRLPRPQGLQHAQRVLHPRIGSAGAGAPLPRRGGAGRRPPGHAVSTARRASATSARRVRRAGLQCSRAASATCRGRQPQRAEGVVTEVQAETLPEGELGREWEWEGSPEVTLAVVESVSEAVELFNRHSPRLVATLVSEDRAEQERFWSLVDAPFVGDGFTRWVDGQFALGRPELGLSNWQHGRLLARSAVLSGDSVFTVRTRAHQHDPDLHR